MGAMTTTPKDNDPDAMAAKTEQQKQAAREPKLPRGKEAAKPKPTESGKPIWDKPHSS